jgi:hypothetical protein
MNEFLERLRSETNMRVPLEQLQRHFYEVFPEVQASPDRGARLLEALRNLEASGHVALPAKGSWETLGAPPLPKWVAVSPALANIPERRDFSTVAWAPELDFWTDLTTSQLTALEHINDFLLRRRGSLRLVPIKERSLEIFGDEKRLDALCGSKDSIFAGRLPLATLGCFRAAQPLPYRQADTPGRPVLVLENHNSFWSFGEWNHDAKRYAAVVYGSGEGFIKTGAALGQVLREVEAVGALYLGDLDPKGVCIPTDFNAKCAPNEQKLEPALDLYRWLLRNGRKRDKDECVKADGALARTWLGDSLGGELESLWRSGCWIPQEALGYEQLMAGCVEEVTNGN